MARSNPPAAGDNSGVLNDEDRAALQHYFANKIRAAEQVAAQKKADLDAARGEVTKLFAGVKAELLVKRKDFEEVLAAAAMSEAEFIAKEEGRRKLFSLQGLPVGAQMDMFSAQPADAASDQQRAYASGKQAGLRADDPKPPTTVASVFHPDWMRGWSDGQEVNLALIGKAEAVLEARKPAAGGTLQSDEPQDEPEADDDEQAALDEDLKRLEQSGWTKPTTEEAAFA